LNGSNTGTVGCCVRWDTDSGEVIVGGEGAVEEEGMVEIEEGAAAAEERAAE